MGPNNGGAWAAGSEPYGTDLGSGGAVNISPGTYKCSLVTILPIGNSNMCGADVGDGSVFTSPMIQSAFWLQEDDAGSGGDNFVWYDIEFQVSMSTTLRTHEADIATKEHAAMNTLR